MREKLRRHRGGPKPRNNLNRGRSQTKQWAEPHTQICRELATRNRLRQQDKYNVVRDYNRQACKRPRANTYTHTHTHTHTDNTQWSLYRKHSSFPRSSGDLPRSPQRTTMEEEKSRFPVRHHSVLDKTRYQLSPFLCLFYSPWREGCYNLSTYASIS